MMAGKIGSTSKAWTEKKKWSPSSSAASVPVSTYVLDVGTIARIEQEERNTVGFVVANNFKMGDIPEHLVKNSSKLGRNSKVCWVQYRSNEDAEAVLAEGSFLWKEQRVSLFMMAKKPETVIVNNIPVGINRENLEGILHEYGEILTYEPEKEKGIETNTVKIQFIEKKELPERLAFKYLKDMRVLVLNNIRKASTCFICGEKGHLARHHNKDDGSVEGADKKDEAAAAAAAVAVKVKEKEKKRHASSFSSSPSIDEGRFRKKVSYDFIKRKHETLVTEALHFLDMASVSEKHSALEKLEQRKPHFANKVDRNPVTKEELAQMMERISPMFSAGFYPNEMTVEMANNSNSVTVLADFIIHMIKNSLTEDDASTQSSSDDEEGME